MRDRIDIRIWVPRTILGVLLWSSIGCGSGEVPESATPNADQEQVAMRIQNARHRRIIGRQANQRLAALAGTDVGRGDTAGLGLGRHGTHSIWVAGA